MDSLVAPLDRTSPRRRLRVVNLVNHLTIHGGAERIAVRIATNLDRERFDSTLVVSRWPRPIERRSSSASEALAQLEAGGVRFRALRRTRKVQLAPWIRLARFMRSEHVDVLHTHQFGTNVWGSVTGRLAGVPVVLAHEHSWSYEGNPVRRFLDREVVSRAADRFIAVSREDQRRMVEVEGVDPARTLHIPLGIGDSPRPARHSVRSELGIPADAPVLGVVGNLRSQKAHQVLIRATAELVGRWPDLRVLLAGTGPERQSLEGLVGELGLQHTVRLLGYRADVPDVLAAMDIAVCSSDFEGTPIAILEYMDAGLPVVATAVGGVPDVLDDGVQGLLVPRRDPEALARAIAELLSDPQRATAMGAHGRERRRTEFTLGVMIRRIEDLYRELVEEKRAVCQR
jgi:glycosyltransferase involved in cell wall biosynthesis